MPLYYQHSEAQIGTTMVLSCTVDKKKDWLPEERFAGDALPGSCLYLRCVLGTVVTLLCLLHFLGFHRRSDFLPPLTTTSPVIIFFRNFFSTYFALIQASFSCLKNQGSNKWLDIEIHRKRATCVHVPHHSPGAAGSRFLQALLFTAAFIDVVDDTVS